MPFNSIVDTSVPVAEFTPAMLEELAVPEFDPAYLPLTMRPYDSVCYAQTVISPS